MLLPGRETVTVALWPFRVFLIVTSGVRPGTDSLLLRSSPQRSKAPGCLRAALCPGGLSLSVWPGRVTRHGDEPRNPGLAVRLGGRPHKEAAFPPEASETRERLTPRVTWVSRDANAERRESPCFPVVTKRSDGIIFSSRV